MQEMRCQDRVSMVQAKMLPEEAHMAHITDAEKQWRLQI
jgi:hypothetical protein